MEEIITIIKQNKANKTMFVPIPKKKGFKPDDQVRVIKKDSEKEFIDKILNKLIDEGLMDSIFTPKEYEDLILKIKAEVNNGE